MPPSHSICDRLLVLLQREPAGVAEHALIKALRADGVTPFAQAELSDPLALFRCHFLLMNGLYRLRLRLWHQAEAHLDIHPLCNRLLPYQRGEAGLALPDPVADFYLDQSRLEQTGREEVELLLSGGLRRLSAWGQRDEALAILGLDQTADEAAVRRRYRKLVMEHHPDRGGDEERLKGINRAMALLRLG